MNRGANYYREGRYIDAAQLFEHTEADLRAYDASERARYGYYRGATLLQLGDMSEAQRWLLFGHQLAAKNRGALSSSERTALREALSSASSRQAMQEASPISPPLAPLGNSSPSLASPSSAPRSVERMPASALPASASF